MAQAGRGRAREAREADPRRGRVPGRAAPARTRRASSSQEPAALQLRYLQTLTEIATEQNSTILFPLPIDLLRPLYQASEKAARERERGGAALGGGRDEPSAEARARRGAARTALNAFTSSSRARSSRCGPTPASTSSSPGEAAIILRFGALDRVEREPGLRWHLPPPHREPRDHARRHARARGVRRRRGAATEQLAERCSRRRRCRRATTTSCTSGFVVQYQIGDPVGVAVPRRGAPRRSCATPRRPRCARWSGATSIDGVLAERRGAIEAEALDAAAGRCSTDYESGIEVESVAAPGRAAAAARARGVRRRDRARTQDRDRADQRGARLRERGRAARARRGARSSSRRRERLPRGEGRGGEGRGGALHARSCVEYQQRARGDAQAPLPRDDGGRAARRCRR